MYQLLVEFNLRQCQISVNQNSIIISLNSYNVCDVNCIIIIVTSIIIMQLDILLFVISLSLSPLACSISSVIIIVILSNITTPTRHCVICISSCVCSLSHQSCVRHSFGRLELWLPCSPPKTDLHQQSQTGLIDFYWHEAAGR